VPLLALPLPPTLLLPLLRNAPELFSRKMLAKMGSELAKKIARAARAGEKGATWVHFFYDSIMYFSLITFMAALFFCFLGSAVADAAFFFFFFFFFLF
jgi:hypothetical protein